MLVQQQACALDDQRGLGFEQLPDGLVQLADRLRGTEPSSAVGEFLVRDGASAIPERGLEVEERHGRTTLIAARRRPELGEQLVDGRLDLVVRERPELAGLRTTEQPQKKQWFVWVSPTALGPRHSQRLQLLEEGLSVHKKSKTFAKQLPFEEVPLSPDQLMNAQMGAVGMAIQVTLADIYKSMEELNAPSRTSSPVKFPRDALLYPRRHLDPSLAGSPLSRLRRPL